MNVLATAAPRAPKPVPPAILSLISVSFYQLKRDFDLLLLSGWSESHRLGVEQLASTLTDACARRGLDDVVCFTRSLARLAALSRAQALPIRPAIREKVAVLLREGERLLSTHSARRSG